MEERTFGSLLRDMSKNGGKRGRLRPRRGRRQLLGEGVVSGLVLGKGQPWATREGGAR